MSETPTEETVDKTTEEKDNPSEDESDLPPLEDIKYDDKSDESLKKKNIVIPEDKKEKKLDDGWLDVLDNGELKKFVLTPGLTERRPERGCLVTIKVETKLLGTDKVVESESFDSLDIILGESDVIQGLDLVIPLMDDKEVARVHIAARFAYGDKGKGEEVPPNTGLECIVHILSVLWLDEETPLPVDDRIRLGNRKKENGNFWFQRQDYSNSITCYKNAIKLLDATEEELNPNEDNEMKKHFDETMKNKSSESEESKEEPKPKIDEQKVQELIELRSNTYNNLAMAQMKIEDFNGALTSVDAVLVVQPNNVKALFRKGKIWAEKGELDLAMECLKKGLTLEPENKAILQELSRFGVKRTKQLQTERNLAKRMLQLDKKEPQKGNLSSKFSLKDKNWRKWSVIGGVLTAGLAVATAVTYKFIQ